MRYFIASIVIWVINAIFSKRGYDSIDDMVVQLIMPGVFISIVASMFVFIFLETKVKNKYLLSLSLALIIFTAFKFNESYHSKKFEERYQEREQLQGLVREINKTLPVRVTDETILNKVNIHFDILTYEYVADKVKSKFDEEKFRRDLDKSKSTLISAACSSPTARKMFQARYTLTYKYYTNKNKMIDSVEINPKVCEK